MRLYAQTGYSFVAFVCSCFGALGPSAFRYLWVFAMLELRQHEALRHVQEMHPLDDSEQAQFLEPISIDPALLGLLLLWRGLRL
jgi:hypothetical protein